MTSDADDGFTLRDYVAARDEAAVVALHNRSFRTARSAGQLDGFLGGPPAGPSIRLVIDAPDGTIVGHQSFTPYVTSIDGARVVTATSGHWMVDPGFRGRGLAQRFRPALVAHDRSFSVVVGFPFDRSARVSRRLPDLVDLGRMRQWVRWASGGDVGRRGGVGVALSAVLVFMTRALARVGATVARRRVRVVVDSRPGDVELDALAARSTAWARCIRIRDSAYVRWRWDGAPTPVRMLAARTGDGALVGWAVIAAEARKTGRCGVVRDLLAAGPAATAALIVAAADALFAGGCGRVTFDLLDPRRSTGAALVAAGFLPRGVGPTMVSRRLDDAAPSVVWDRRSWYATSGDADQL